jgi:hypothetical protein
MTVSVLARGLIAAFLIPFLAGPSATIAAAPPSPEQVMHSDPFTGFEFPRRIGSYTFQNQVRYNRVSAGYGVNYVENAGARATIIVYDMNFTDIQDGLTDPRVLEEFRKIQEGLDGMIPQGAYRSVSRNDSMPTLSKAWLQVNHDLVDRNGVRLQTYSFIRGQNRKFVKIRVTTPSQASYSRLPSFLLGVSRAIGMMKS